MPNDKNIGMITEQGDLGLGFNPLNEEDTQTLQESESSNDKHNTKSKEGLR